jgi:hypothetical protein
MVLYAFGVAEYFGDLERILCLRAIPTMIKSQIKRFIKIKIFSIFREDHTWFSRDYTWLYPREIKKKQSMKKLVFSYTLRKRRKKMIFFHKLSN